MLQNNEEKIVSLATELLKNNTYRNQSKFPKRRFENLSLNLTTILMTTLLATAVGYHAGSHGRYSYRLLNRYEKVEMQALIFYASKVRNLNEVAIRHEVERFVGAPINEMNAKDFPLARSFLQDIINPN